MIIRHNFNTLLFYGMMYPFCAESAAKHQPTENVVNPLTGT